MKKKLLLGTVSATLSLSLLAACGTNDNNLNDNNRDGTNITPVRNNRQHDEYYYNQLNRNPDNPYQIDPVLYDRDNYNNYNNNNNNRGNNDGGFMDVNNENDRVHNEADDNNGLFNNNNNDGLFNNNNNNDNNDLFDYDNNRKNNR